MRVTLIHNPDAGDGSPTRQELLDLLRKHGYEATYHSSHEPAWERVLEVKTDMVVVAGGDGTVEKVGRKLAGRRIPIALLPLGTANNVATSLGAAEYTPGQVDRWKSVHGRTFDLGVARANDAREMRFLESVGCGLFASLLRLHEQRQPGALHRVSRWSEMKSAQDDLRELIRTCRPQHVHLQLDGQDHSGEFALVEVMNTPCIGPGLRLAPGADPGDGWLDVVLLDASQIDVLHDYLRQKQWDTDRPPILPVRRARRVRLDAENQPVHVDDELWEGGRAESSEIDIHLDPGSLCFIAA